ncbi:putative coiled-coil domain-containing protein [Apostichopus japonicus]|uniref:Putative coiled-coil domain-containing protein n=2 Tax=Stichopus japonicus TaxID=307972 RepID=A0A2G8K8V5_STIJA|nr:putative coiled-coil domain-containing protein [Apostichopus japonicus]
MPEREDDHLTPATRLLEKRREMAEVESALGGQKEEFQMKMESLQQRREELERKEFQLKESLQKFDKFLKENDSKRARAVKKAHDETDLRKTKEMEISRLDTDIGELESKKKKLMKRLDKHRIYHRYLERTLETAEEFQEIREIIARYETLVATHQDLVDKSNQTQDAVDYQKSQLVKFTEDKNNEILNFNNQLAMLQTRLDKAQSEAVKWESVWTHIKNTAAKKTLLLGRIKMATHNLFQLVNRHLKQSSSDGDNTVEQLTKIQMFIMDLTQITTEIKRAEAVGTTASGAS